MSNDTIIVDFVARTIECLLSTWAETTPPWHVLGERLSTSTSGDLETTPRVLGVEARLR